MLMNITPLSDMSRFAISSLFFMNDSHLEWRKVSVLSTYESL